MDKDIIKKAFNFIGDKFIENPFETTVSVSWLLVAATGTCVTLEIAGKEGSILNHIKLAFNSKITNF